MGMTPDQIAQMMQQQDPTQTLQQPMEPQQPNTQQPDINSMDQQAIIQAMGNGGVQLPVPPEQPEPDINPMDVLPEVILQYMDHALGIKNNTTLNEDVKSQVMSQMAQAINYLVPLLPNDEESQKMQMEFQMKQQEQEQAMYFKQQELQMKQQEMEMSMRMKQAEMQMKQQEQQQKLEMDRQMNQQKLQQEQENHAMNIVQQREQHENQMEQQKQAAQLKQSSNQGSDKGK